MSTTAPDSDAQALGEGATWPIVHAGPVSPFSTFY